MFGTGPELKEKYEPSKVQKIKDIKFILAFVTVLALLFHIFLPSFPAGHKVSIVIVHLLM